MSDTGLRGLCRHCGKRIYQQELGKYMLRIWQHANGDRECVGLMCKYAEPKAADV